MSKRKLQPEMAVNIGEKLRNARLARGISLRELARRIQMEHANVVRWEAGKAEPGLYSALKIADALDMTIEQLVGEGPYALENEEPHGT